jgi:hypothetical protein
MHDKVEERNRSATPTWRRGSGAEGRRDGPLGRSQSGVERRSVRLKPGRIVSEGSGERGAGRVCGKKCAPTCE